MRRYVENEMNQRLDGYTVHVGRARFNPIAFAVYLDNVTLTQNANPDPPVARIHGMRASLYWRDLLRLHIVGEFLVDRPRVYVNLAHFRAEQRSNVSIQKKGWQDAVQAIYPIKINELRIDDGDLTYVDQGPYRPLHAGNIQVRASNIRNIISPEEVYPSSVRVEGRIFDKGSLTLDGRADFLREPHMAFKGSVELVGMDLSYFEPVLIRNNLSVRSGTLSTGGNLEYTPKLTEVNLGKIDLDDVRADYIHLPQTSGEEKERVRKATAHAERLSNEPTTRIRIDSLNIRRSNFAYTDKTATPPMRIFLSDVSGALGGFTNQLEEGPSTLNMQGKFMGSGEARVTGTFRPETQRPDLSLRIAIENTQMTAMNNLFRSAVGFDVKGGQFFLYSDLRIQGDTIHGWVKPIFKELKIGDRKDDEKKGILHKAYVGAAKVLARVLENRSREQVATRTDISGPIENPNTSLWQIVTNLVKNAWIRAILPGFRSEASHASQQ
jgi:hypothetical protein